jgi:hypothetical protein
LRCVLVRPSRRQDHCYRAFVRYRR